MASGADENGAGTDVQPSGDGIGDEGSFDPGRKRPMVPLTSTPGGATGTPSTPTSASPGAAERHHRHHHRHHHHHWGGMRAALEVLLVRLDVALDHRREHRQHPGSAHRARLAGVGSRVGTMLHRDAGRIGDRAARVARHPEPASSKAKLNGNKGRSQVKSTARPGSHSTAARTKGPAAPRPHWSGAGANKHGTSWVLSPHFKPGSQGTAHGVTGPAHAHPASGQRKR
jgi:hypothetical protein